MPRRELLTDEQRVQLFAFPPDRTELIRLATLSSTDLVFIRQHRQVMNRLGIAVQMVYLRSLGRAIGARERPYPPLLELLAEQLYMEPSSWNAYAVRAETRREHLVELFALLQMTTFEQIHQPEMVEYLLPVARQTTQGIALAQALIVELRKRRIALPSIAVLERICATASTRAQRSIHQMLIAPFSAEQRLQLDALLELRGDTPISTLTWLRRPAGKPSAKSVLAHLERLKAIKELHIPAGLSRSVPQQRLGKLAREGMQTAVYQLAEYEKERRYATVIAILIDTNATLIDEILNLHDRILGSFFTRDKHQFAKKFSDEGKSVNEKVRLYAKVGALLIGAKEQGLDPFQEIERVFSWDRFIESVREAEKLSRDEEFDALTLLASHFTQLRRYSPIFLETFDFHAAPVASEILKGIGILREMNHTNARKVPTDAPMGFIRPRWQRFVQQGEEIDRRYYEFAVMSELKNALRGGDIWVPGSRQFKDFDEYLLPQEEFAKQHQDACLGLPVATTAKAYFEERLQCLHQELERTNALAASGELPDVELSEKGLKISPLEDETPDGADKLRYQAYHLLPRVKITDLLLEVDQWTNFTQMFTHLKSGDEHKERTLLLTAILADAFNLGLEKMADACPGTSFAKLSWLQAWHIRDETYTNGLAKLVNYQHCLPLAAFWGEGKTSSSDGQRFRAGSHGEASGYRNAKYGDEPGVLFYTHVSDKYAPFHTKVLSSPVRDATHVLDGLLYHESDLRIEEHYTDTAGFTEHVFALCHLLGFTFAPRIADLADKSLYVPGKASQWPALAPLISTTSLRIKLAEQQFPEALRLAASIKQGTVTASLILRKLSAYPRQNSLALALREMGRIERSIFTLKWLQDPTLRRRVLSGLNKGEARNALARAVFFQRLGEIRDRSYENQRYRASGLNLVTAAIILWNTVYLERAVAALRQQSTIDDTLLAHLAPLGWNHINLTGDYSWNTDKRVARGQFRPLRRPGPSTQGA